MLLSWSNTKWVAVSVCLFVFFFGRGWTGPHNSPLLQALSPPSLPLLHFYHPLLFLLVSSSFFFFGRGWTGPHNSPLLQALSPPSLPLLHFYHPLLFLLVSSSWFLGMLVYRSQITSLHKASSGWTRQGLQSFSTVSCTKCVIIALGRCR